MSAFSNTRANTRKASKLISHLSIVHNIKISGFLRDKKNKSIIGVVIGFVPPIQEEELEQQEREQG